MKLSSHYLALSLILVAGSLPDPAEAQLAHPDEIRRLRETIDGLVAGRS